MRFCRPLALVMLLCLGCASTPTAVAPHAESADVAAYRADVQTLASPAMEGRGAGTVGLNRARDFLVERFAAAGLAPGIVLPDGSRSWTQPFDVRLGVEVKSEALAYRAGDGASVALTPGNDFSTLGFSAPGRFDAPAAFVGYGIVAPEFEYDSYGDTDAVRGKVAITFRYEPQDAQGISKWARQSEHTLGAWTESASLVNKALWAAERGAVALLVVTPPSQVAASSGGDALKPARLSTAPETATIPVVHITLDTLRRLVRLAGHDHSAVRQFQHDADRGPIAPIPLGNVRIQGDIQLHHPTAVLHNVVGVVPGRGKLADEFVVVGAHYDHLGYGEIGSLSKTPGVHHGADDNASGAAGLIHLARHAVRSSAAAPTTPRRSILFVAFSGEERGLLGSAYLVNHLEQLGITSSQIAAMLNMDMIGRLRDHKLYVIGVGTGEGLDTLLTRAAGAHGLRLVTTGSAFGASDHANFQFKRIPAVHFFTGSHEDYHRPSDTADKINAHGAVRVLGAVEHVMYALVTQPHGPDFIDAGLDPHTMHRAPGPGGGAHLGVLPDYATLEGSDGCRITGVAPNSPADRAGLRSGDVIIKWAGQPLPNVRALTLMLHQSKPGDVVTLTVQRNGDVLELQVELGQR